MGSVNFKKHEADAVDLLCTRLTKDFQTHALKYGWNKTLVSQMSVILDDEDTVVIQYPDSLRDQVEDLEYGELGEPPAPAIRTFKNIIKEFVHNSMEDAVVNSLFDSDVFE